MKTNPSNIIPIKWQLKEDCIVKIRSEYLNAQLGVHPSIAKIHKALAIDESILKIEEAMLIAKNEDWQAVRDFHLEQLFPTSKIELKLTIDQRNLEIVQILQNQIKITNRLDLQYLTRGKVNSLDGSSEISDYRYDPRNISLLILSMSEIYKSAQYAAHFVNSFQATKARDNLISPIVLQQIKKLQSLPLDSLIAEGDRMNKLMQQLEYQSQDHSEEIRQQHIPKS